MEGSKLGDFFDKQIRSLDGLPDVVKTAPSVIRHLTPVAELAQTFTVQTYRHKEYGDFVFVEYVSAEGFVRVVLPPGVADCISRQRDALSTKNRKRAGRMAAAARKAAGIQPAFLKSKGRKRRGKAAAGDAGK